MSEKDFLQEEGPTESNDAQERAPITDSRELDKATHEPEALVESTRGFEEAEQIETSVTELMDSQDKISATPIPLPSQSLEDEGATPQPIPEPAEGGRPASPGEEVEAIPINLPYPRLEDEISAMPIARPGLGKADSRFRLRRTAFARMNRARAG